jgi:glycosyltransferase involved in cell wall biosynthesis
MLRREKVTHMHAHFATAPTLIAMLTHELTGIPYTFTAHARDIYVDTPPELLLAEIQQAAAVVTVSEYNMRYLSAQLGLTPNDKVHCIYNGLDLSIFEYRQPRASDGNPPVILSVGRLIEKKGFGDLIASAAILRRRGHRFRVEIVGAGPLLPALEAQVRRLGLKSCVQFLGAQPQETVQLDYRRATLFALPCVVTADGDRDGIPTVLLEAMASGTPVVSTEVSGIPELIESGSDGLLVEPNNPALLADALEQLLIDPELRNRLAQAARQKIEERFAIDRNCAQLLALFPQGGSC